MRFKGLDLNLLVALDTLLETRSVARSAERLCLSQAAVSAALSRLRAFFDDPILVLDGRQMHPTAYAEALFPMVKETLRSAEMLTSTSARFDPATADRAFHVMASDAFVAAVIPQLMRRLSESAPGIRLELLAMVPGHNQILGVGGADLSIVPDIYASREHPADTLYHERHVVVGCADNPLLATPLSEADFLAAGHVVPIFGGGDNKSYADEQLDVMGKVRKIEVMTSSFTAVPWLLMGTRLLSLMSERLATMMARQLPLAIADCPIQIPPMAQVAQYHRARRDDAGLKWLREQLRAEVQQAGAPAALA